jgi:hypothetical protein
MTVLDVHHEAPPGARDVIDTVSRQGYYRSPSRVSFEDFRRIAEAFGEIFYEADVRMGGERPRNYQLPAAIDFHTDHVSAEVAAWYCLERESDGGAMQFIDLKPIAEHLSEEQLAALGRVRVPDNAVWSEGGDIPLCTKENGRWSFHYVPWLELRAPDGAARNALDRLEAGIAQAKSASIIECDLLAGEMVFVDNHRVMHGRAAIPTGSQRNLKRFWVRSGRSGEKAA